MSLLELFIFCLIGGFVMGVPIGIHLGFNERDREKWGDE
jgi:hypothetical protein